MKTFVVIAAATSQVRDDGRVMMAHTAEREIAADYYRVVDGALIFRTEKRGNEQYNPAVRVFAPGFWAEVYEKKTLQARVEEVRQRMAGAREIDLPEVRIEPGGSFHLDPDYGYGGPRDNQ